MNMNEAYVTIEEFADRLKLHHMTIRRYIKNGRIQAFRIGSTKKSHWRIPLSEIHRIALMDMTERK